MDIKEVVHTPVLLEESLQALKIKPNGHYIDCTLGEGSFSYALLERSAPLGRVLAFELNPTVIERAKIRLQSFGDRITIVNRNYKDIATVVDQGWKRDTPIDGIYFDIGISRFLIEQARRGISFLRDEIFDLRFGNEGTPAWEIINKAPREEIERIIREYGEESQYRFATDLIIQARKKNHLVSSLEVANTLLPLRKYNRGKIHYATKVFQAFRIASNDELNTLKIALDQSVRLITTGGRLVVVAYHSLEDRIVKEFFKTEAQKGTVELITKKAIKASFDEVRRNPSARSARLRVLERV